MESTPTREIPLTKGQVAIVDAKHYDRIVAMGKWHALFCKATNSYYAARSQTKKRYVYMHRLVMNAPPGAIVDHRRQSETLRNTEDNLRLVTRRQNNLNSRSRKHNTSGFRGIALTRSGKWCAHVSLGNGKIWSKTIEDKEEAARAFDAKAKEVYGEFAMLNFPEVAP
jgi:hypothetical protein